MSGGHLSEQPRGICTPTVEHVVRQPPSKSSDTVSPHEPQPFQRRYQPRGSPARIQGLSSQTTTAPSLQICHRSIPRVRTELEDVQDVADDAD